MRSCYITAAGYRALEAENQSLWRRRREVVKHLAAAAAEGDRSENAEYQYRKKQLRELDRRIRYLQRRLPELQVVCNPPIDPTRIFFAALVAVRHGQRPVDTYRIVGADEIDPASNRISIDSPVARALIGRRVGDCVTVATPDGDAELEVVAVSYPVDD